MTEIEMQMLQAIKAAQSERADFRKLVENLRREYNGVLFDVESFKRQVMDLLPVLVKEYENTKAETEKLGAQVELLNKQSQLFMKQLNELGK